MYIRTNKNFIYLVIYWQIFFPNASFVSKIFNAKYIMQKINIVQNVLFMISQILLLVFQSVKLKKPLIILSQVQQNSCRKFKYVLRTAMLEKNYWFMFAQKRAPCRRVSICFFSSAKRELSPATPSSLHKGGFYNCEGSYHHAITKDFASRSFFSLSPFSRSPSRRVHRPWHSPTHMETSARVLIAARANKPA